MTHAPSIRRAVSLLPPCATTGIGSLPHTQLELALQTALAQDLPYLPQLPNGNPGELMIASVLEGLPGARFDQDGMVTIDLDQWKAARDEFGLGIEKALQNDALEPFEPSPTACRAFRPFLWEVEHRKLAFAKAQLSGPATVRWVAKTSEGEPASRVAELDRQIFRFILAKAIALTRAFRRANTTPLIYLDEPGLYALDLRDPAHLMVLQELKMLVVALQREGALVGIHCCSNTQWGAILGLGADLISLDVRLSLDALVEDREAFARFIASGATLSLGIIPTNLDSSYDVRELCDSVEATLRSTVGTRRFGELLSRCVLTPACGLAMRTVVDTERIFDELRAAQKRLKARADEEQPSVQSRV
jgi:hypothetical protein